MGDWISFVVVGLGTLFLIGELLVNMRGLFGIIGFGFITFYFLDYLDPGMFFIMLAIYVIGIILIVIDGKFINDGTLATIGAVCMILSVGLSSPNWVAGLYAVIGVIIGGFASLFFLKVFKRRDMWTKLTLVDQLTGDKGYSTMNHSYSDLVDKEGITLTDMRPVGTVRIKDHDYSAVTNGQWIKKDTLIRVTHVDGTKILVSKIESDAK
ncbi:nodulation protein NfeD [Aquibacillus koreensis]|uniref:Nodulation protein NfeD n=1 Tax=Aquibacillus koreensis TaxID=279446 RepID=A0A9X4AGK0_9BACI|nr:NfeD family protein [Aquibacillus koreensis]MCT2537575.1 nodulation protein NfeD [Aquibacillus koreensis]MDC3419021.1 nodulation protein NfeD [Aquibacillus koreensis]